MKRPLPFACALALLAAGVSWADGDKTSPRQLQFNLRVLEGDPLGSPEAGSVKVLAEPRVVTLENRPAILVVGGEVPFLTGANTEYAPVGRRVELKPGPIQNGKVRLDTTLSYTTAGKRTKDASQFHTESTRTLATVGLGEVVKLRWGKGTADRQVWLEFTVIEFRP